MPLASEGHKIALEIALHEAVAVRDWLRVIGLCRALCACEKAISMEKAFGPADED